MTTDAVTNPSVAIVDARQWQNQFDLKTGVKSELTGEAINLIRKTLARHPYPGDLNGGSNRWVTETALDLLATYQPDFTLLTYAEQYFTTRIETVTTAQRAQIMMELRREVEAFIEQSGVTPIIVGRGGVIPSQGSIDLSGLEGVGVSPHWSARYAGIQGPTSQDLDWLQNHPHVEKLVTKEAYLQLFTDAPPELEILPDYLLVAQPGFAFKALGCTMRKPAMVPAAEPELPCMSAADPVTQLTDIRQSLDRGLQRGERMALILLEGVGNDDFPWPFTPCANNLDWFCYEPGDAQLLAITSGCHRLHEYPPGYLFYLRELRNNLYPLSGYFKAIPSGTIGAEYPGRSIAVGNKSMAMHMVAGADLSVECFSRNHFNQGTLGVVHRQDKIAV